MTEPCGRLAKTHVTLLCYVLLCQDSKESRIYTVPPLPVIEQHINNNHVVTKSAGDARVRGPPHKHREQTPSQLLQGPAAQGSMPPNRRLIADWAQWLGIVPIATIRKKSSNQFLLRGAAISKRLKQHPPKSL